MLVREALNARLTRPDPAEGREGRVSLPRTLKSDRIGARTMMLQRLAASRLFALGDRRGVLKAAQKRSGRAFRLDVRQRVIVKALVSRHAGDGLQRSAALLAHVAYLGRSGAGVEGARPSFFDRSREEVEAAQETALWATDRHHFRFIVSPEHGDRIGDLRRFTREVMRRVADDLGEPQLAWIGTCHFDTDQPHAHVLVRGRRANGKDLVIPRDYVGYGFRARAQEVAQELLGDLSRAEAERRIWKETQADRFTGFDRRLLQAADPDRMVEDGVSASDAWAALSRGRLRHLERLGLAQRVGARYRLDTDLEARLRSLQLRRDVIRTLQQRRIEAGRDVRELDAPRLKGRVVKSGAHDELGGGSFVIVRDGQGAEHYARLQFGQRPPDLGKTVDLLRTDRGGYVLGTSRGLNGRELG
jgi:type IV secretory pathway VirD2 relaxase